MGAVIYTEERQPWARRVGGAYPNMFDLELAADMLEFDVLVGPRDQRGYWMVPVIPKETDASSSSA